MAVRSYFMSMPDLHYPATTAARRGQTSSRQFQTRSAAAFCQREELQACFETVKLTLTSPIKPCLYIYLKHVRERGRRKNPGTYEIGNIVINV